MAKEPFEVVDPSGLTDADWAELNKLRKAYAAGGQKTLNSALNALNKEDPIRYATIIGAIFPDELREAIKDEMAELGMTEEDVRELICKLESPARDQ